MNQLSLWCVIAINTFCAHASEQNHQEYAQISLTSILLPKSCDEKIDLEHIEPFKNKPIKEFIIETKETGTPWLFALCHNEGNTHHIYNALDLITWCTKSDRDPCTKFPIKNIDFFTCEHINEQLNIAHVGTQQDLSNHQSLLTLLFFYLKSEKIEQKNNVAILISHFYAAQKDFQTAINWCQKAAKNDDLNAIAELGYLFKEHGDIDMAYIYLKEAADRGDIYAAINLGNLYAQNGELNLAVRWLKIGADQKIPEAMSQLGKAYYKLGQTDKAIQVLTDAISLHNNPSTITDLAFAYQTKSEFNKAVDLYVKAAELGQPTLDLFYTLHLAIGYPTDEYQKKWEQYADALVDKINRCDPDISSFKQTVPDRYHTATEILSRYATKPILDSEE